MTEERRKEWAEHILNESKWRLTSLVPGVLHSPVAAVAVCLESFGREVAEHARREEREACALLVARTHWGEYGSRLDLRESIEAAIRSREV